MITEIVKASSDSAIYEKQIENDGGVHNADGSDWRSRRYGGL